jgi:glutathione S-transferase
VITLYHAHHSTCSQKVRIVLQEKKLEFEAIQLDLGRKDQLEPEYLALNPNGVVPTLVDGDDVICDSSVICEYLDERYPEPRLSPDDIVARAHMREWMRFFEEVPTAAIRTPSFNRAFLYRFDGLDQASFEAEQMNVRKVRKELFERMGKPTGFSGAEIDRSLERLGETCARMDAALADGRPWLMGGQFTLADVVVIPSVDRMADLGLSHVWEGKYRHVGEWYARFRARPSFRATYYPGSRVSEFLELRPLYVDAG